MFILPNQPRETDSVPELADFFELRASSEGTASITDISRILGRSSDNLDNDGCIDNDSKTMDRLNEIVLEIERRKKSCLGHYPYEIIRGGNVIKFSFDQENYGKCAYMFLLLSTRLNMNDNRRQENLDGTQILEELSTCVAKNYLGKDRVKALTFGTAVAGSFREKVENLCMQIGEGGGYYHKSTPEHAVDGKLDVVAWVPFADDSPGKIILFGQCKTGTTWKDQVSQLQPQAFINKYMRRCFPITPTRAFFISASLERGDPWHEACSDGGIIFDRCRIVDCLTGGLPTDLFDKLRTWTMSAMKINNTLTPGIDSGTIR